MPILEILPETRFTSTHDEDLVSVTLHFPDQTRGVNTYHSDPFPLPASGWDDTDVLAAIQAQYPDHVVSFRLPEQAPAPEEHHPV